MYELSPEGGVHQPDGAAHIRNWDSGEKSPVQLIGRGASQELQTGFEGHHDFISELDDGDGPEVQENLRDAGHRDEHYVEVFAESGNDEFCAGDVIWPDT